MKISHEIRISAPAEKAWRVLTDFSSYPEWNPLLPSVEGRAEPEQTLRAVVSPLGLDRRKIGARVTGFIAPRYFSLESAHRLGEWFYREEFVFRMKEKEGGVLFFAEAYVTGLSLRFRRASVERGFRLPLLRLAEAFKDRVEAAGS